MITRLSSREYKLNYLNFRANLGSFLVGALLAAPSGGQGKQCPYINYGIIRQTVIFNKFIYALPSWQSDDIMVS
jgi:hypothetical protein